NCMERNDTGRALLSPDPRSGDNYQLLRQRPLYNYRKYVCPAAGTTTAAAGTTTAATGTTTAATGTTTAAPGTTTAATGTAAAKYHQPAGFRAEIDPGDGQHDRWLQSLNSSGSCRVRGRRPRRRRGGRRGRGRDARYCWGRGHVAGEVLCDGR